VYAFKTLFLKNKLVTTSINIWYNTFFFWVITKTHFYYFWWYIYIFLDLFLFFKCKSIYYRWNPQQQNMTISNMDNNRTKWPPSFLPWSAKLNRRPLNNSKNEGANAKRISNILLVIIINIPKKLVMIT
jgi:hypothetical protein